MPQNLYNNVCNQLHRKAESSPLLQQHSSMFGQCCCNNNYGDGTDSIFATQVPTDGIGTKTYSLTFTTTVSASDSTKYDKYTLTATPVTPQDADVCHVLTLKSTGEKVANGVSPDTANCWE